MKIRHAPASITLNTVGDRAFETAGHYSVTYTVGLDSFTIEVPSGFVTDLGSVPKIARSLVSVASGPVAFVTHDYCYRAGIPGLKRATADRLMLELMHYRGAPKSRVQRYMAWAAVRVGGFRSFNKVERRNGSQET